MTDSHQRPDLASSQSDAKRDHADDLGTVVPLRTHDYSTVATAKSDLSNVIPFTRHGSKTPGKNAPVIEVTVADRPAPRVFLIERQRRIALLIGGSLLVHGAMFAAFNRQPEPHASLGIISITAEIILGAQSNAGRSANPSESEGIENPSSPKTDRPDETKLEIARKDIAKGPVEEPTEAKQKETMAPKMQEPPSRDNLPEPKTQAELAAQPEPIEKPALDQNKPKTGESKKRREAARPARNDGESTRDRASPAAAPALGSNSVGRGRSDLDTNYAGIVAAHLARFKQFPADAQRRGDHGTATIYFSLSGGGSVTSVRLVRGSGVPSIDQEATAMVRRASPFPAPPSGRPIDFTRSLNFGLQ